MLLRTLAVAATLTFGASALAANPAVELDTTAGTIRIELYPDAAPKTVANFLDYVKAKHYDGTQFHRVIDAQVASAAIVATTTREPGMKESIGAGCMRTGHSSSRG